MKKSNWVKKIIAVLIALALWQLAAMTIHQKILLVSPIEVIIRLGTIWQVQGFAASIWFTFYHIVAGFLIGFVTGILFAVAAAKLPWVENLLWPWMVTIKSVPVASFVVICLIWLSSENLSVFISFLIVVPIIYQNMLSGLKAYDKNSKEMAQVFAIPWYRRLRYITIPQIRPYLISAAGITTGMAWKAGVAAEIIGTPNGSIGKMLYLAKIYLDTDDLLAWTVIIVLLSVFFEKVFMLILKLVLGEYPCKRTKKYEACNSKLM